MYDTFGTNWVHHRSRGRFGESWHQMESEDVRSSVSHHSSHVEYHRWMYDPCLSTHVHDYYNSMFVLSLHREVHVHGPGM